MRPLRIRASILLALPALALGACGSSSHSSSSTVGRTSQPPQSRSPRSAIRRPAAIRNGYYHVGQPCTPRQQAVYAKAGLTCSHHKLVKK